MPLRNVNATLLAELVKARRDRHAEATRARKAAVAAYEAWAYMERKVQRAKLDGTSLDDTASLLMDADRARGLLYHAIVEQHQAERNWFAADEIVEHCERQNGAAGH